MVESAPVSEGILQVAANTIRFLSADGVEKAKSGHPGMPMGMAEIAAVLFLKHLRFNPQDPNWLARDRFVLSNGHGSMLLYSLLHLAGYDLTIDDLKSFRQWGSKTPGHPEAHLTPGVETTTGPLGQGIANAVGLAIAQKVMQARYEAGGFNPVDHKVYAFCGDGCLMEGVASEASSLAGHLGLNNLVLIYDDNKISIAGRTSLAFSEDVAKRYQAYGWDVQEIDGHDLNQIDDAISRAKNNTKQPSLIVAKTVIGKGSPKKSDTAEVHGAPLGSDELKAAKEAINWPVEPAFYVPEEVYQAFKERNSQLQLEYSAWQNGYSDWSAKNPELLQKLNSQLKLELPQDLEQKLIAALPQDGKAVATRKLSETVLQAASAAVNSLIGGSADLEPSTLTLIKGSGDISAQSFSDLNLRFGVREHAMASIMNGFAYYGGFIPYGSTFFVFLDYLRPALRLAALSKLPSLYIFTHDSIFVGEDGPTHQPIEHLAILRATPNVYTFRPADGLETAVSYAQALARKEGPSALILTRQNLTPFERPVEFKVEDIHRGAYTVLEVESGRNPQLIIVATGSEVPLALAVARLLAPNAVRVVSMPCCEAFRAQPATYRNKLLPYEASKLVIELGCTFGWYGLVDGSPENTLLVGLDHFGASAPFAELAEQFGFTAQKIANQARERFFKCDCCCGCK